MSRTRWASSYRTGYDSNSTTSRHFFTVMKNRLEEWSRRIPRKGALRSSHTLCDLHFEDRFIIKSDEFLINGQNVLMPRENWRLTKDAASTIFPNLPKYLSSKLPRQRNIRRLNSEVKVSSRVTDIHPSNMLEEELQADDSCTVVDDLPCTVQTVRRHRSARPCTNCEVLAAKVYVRNKQIRSKNSQIQLLCKKLYKLQMENEQLCKKLDQFERLPSKTKQIVLQVTRSLDVKSVQGNRYSADWLVDALLIKVKSPSAYKLLRTQAYLPLPSVATLNCSIKNLRPDWIWSQSVCCLSRETKGIPSD